MGLPSEDSSGEPVEVAIQPGHEWKLSRDYPIN
jgi:hypothetical protein